jgi:hypothetical protein
MASKTAIIVLGGGIQDNALSQVSLLRLISALRLFDIRKNILVFSGGVGFLNRDKPKKAEALLMLEEAKKRLGNIDGLFVEDESVDTISNAYYSRKILDSLRINHLMIVTSKSHVLRAKWIFEKVFYDKQIDYFISINLIDHHDGEKIFIDETNLLKFTKKWLSHLPDGDMNAIGKFLQNEHPGYASKSKVTVETFKRLVTKII